MTGVKREEGEVTAKIKNRPEDPGGTEVEVRTGYTFLVQEEHQKGNLCGAVILHGFGLDRFSLLGHAERLAEKGCATVAPSMLTLFKNKERNIGLVQWFVEWLQLRLNSMNESKSVSRSRSPNLR